MRNRNRGREREEGNRKRRNPGECVYEIENWRAYRISPLIIPQILIFHLRYFHLRFTLRSCTQSEIYRRDQSLLRLSVTGSIPSSHMRCASCWGDLMVLQSSLLLLSLLVEPTFLRYRVATHPHLPTTILHRGTGGTH